jgi:hypothetical protein
MKQKPATMGGRTTNSRTCERCPKKTATHILCDCQATAYLRFHHVGNYIMEPSNCYDAIRKALHFIRSVSSTEG